MHVSSRSLKKVAIVTAIFFCLFMILYWRRNSDSDNDSDYNSDSSGEQSLTRLSLDHNNNGVNMDNQHQHRGITKEEFLQASQLARELGEKCRANVQQPGCITQDCPVLPFGFNGRPKNHPENEIGNNCEPWMRRDAVLLLNQLVKPYFTVLEWSSGSSTIWTLPRVSRMISVENNAEWARSVIKTVESMGLSHKVQFHVIPGTNEGPEWAKSFNTGQYFVDYVGVKLPTELNAKYDMIIVDGRARSACLQRAVALLKPEGGILVLDNSDRKYKKDYVPTYWLRFTSINAQPVETTVWLSQLPSQ